MVINDNIYLLSVIMYKYIMYPELNMYSRVVLMSLKGKCETELCVPVNNKSYID